MEAAFSRDFSGVRLHTDAGAAEVARSIDAHAYTIGSHIGLDQSRYDPGSRAGRHLLAHELAHVVQQGGGDPPPDTAARVEPARTRWEHEADQVAARIAAGASSGPVSRVPGLGIQRGRAGGCVVPELSDSQVGVEAHRVIEGWAQRQYPPTRGEVPIPGGSCSREETGNTGSADLLREDPNAKDTEIGEIKPFSQRLFSNPWRQLECYKRYYQGNNPGRTVRSMTWVPAPPENPSVFRPPPGGAQFLNCSSPTDGVYFYWCTKTKRRRGRRWRQPPVQIPKEVWDRIQRELDQWRERLRGFPIDAPVPLPERVPDVETAPGEETVPEETVPEEGTPEEGTPEEGTPEETPDEPGKVIPFPRPPVIVPAPAEPEELPLAAKVAIGLLVAVAVVVLAIVLLPEELVAAALAAIVGAFRVLAALATGLTLTFGGGGSLAFASEGGEGKEGGEGESGQGAGSGSGSGSGSGATAAPGRTGSGQAGGKTKGTPGATAEAGTTAGTPGGTSPAPTTGGQPGTAPTLEGAPGDPTTAAPGPAGTTGTAPTPGKGGATPGGAGGRGKAGTAAKKVQDLQNATDQASKVADSQKSAADKQRKRGGTGTGKAGGAGKVRPVPGASSRHFDAEPTLPSDVDQSKLHTFPIKIVSGVTASSAKDTVHRVTIVVDKAPTFTVDVSLKVISNSRGKLVLEVVEPWWVEERQIGSAAGVRYHYDFNPTETKRK